MGIGRELYYDMLADQAYLDSKREQALANRCWITKDGLVISVKEMTDGHLANAIRMMQRGCHGAFGPEYAKEALDMLAHEADVRGLLSNIRS